MQKMREDYAKPLKPFRSHATKNSAPVQSKAETIYLVVGTVLLFLGLAYLLLGFFQQ